MWKNTLYVGTFLKLLNFFTLLHSLDFFSQINAEEKLREIIFATYDRIEKYAGDIPMKIEFL